MSATLPAGLPGLSSGDLTAPVIDRSPRTLPNDPPVVSTATPAVHSGPFSPAELERFRAEDAAAGRTICTILTTLFTACVLLATGVITWTYLFAIQSS